MPIPTRDQFLYTESFESLMNSNNNVFIGGARRKSSSRRSQPSPGDPLHKETIEYLKNEKKLPELDARAYKSIAYRAIKEQYPEAKHLERAQKMLELVKSKSFIKDFASKLEDTKKILENLDSEREKRNSESESKPAQAGGYSETSILQNYTESRTNQPYYRQYMQAKMQYLRQKGGFDTKLPDFSALDDDDSGGGGREDYGSGGGREDSGSGGNNSFRGLRPIGSSGSGGGSDGGDDWEVVGAPATSTTQNPSRAQKRSAAHQEHEEAASELAAQIATAQEAVIAAAAPDATQEQKEEAQEQTAAAAEAAVASVEAAQKVVDQNSGDEAAVQNLGEAQKIAEAIENVANVAAALAPPVPELEPANIPSIDHNTLAAALEPVVAAVEAQAQSASSGVVAVENPTPANVEQAEEHREEAVDAALAMNASSALAAVATASSLSSSVAAPASSNLNQENLLPDNVQPNLGSSSIANMTMNLGSSNGGPPSGDSSLSGNSSLSSIPNLGSRRSVDSDLTRLPKPENLTRAFFQSQIDMLTEELQKIPAQQGGSIYSETSQMQNYTESNAKQPYYQQYMQAKKQYLKSKYRM